MTCYGGNNGAATVSVTGGLGDFSVIWDNGSFSFTPDDLPAGDNNVLIYERGRRIATEMVNITEPTELTAEVTTSNYANGYSVSCVDCYNGTATVTPAGGTATYTYSWNDYYSSTTAQVNNFGPGDYVVTVTDANGCTVEANVKMNAPPANAWSKEGNDLGGAGNAPAEFIGTTDATDVIFKRYNQEVLRIEDNLFSIQKPVKFLNVQPPSTGASNLRIAVIDDDGVLRGHSWDNLLPAPTPSGLSCLGCGCSPFLGWGKPADQINGVTTPHVTDDIIKCPSEGNVGIGLIPEANSKLDLAGDIAISGSRLHVGYDGKVGIGTDNPQYLLDIQNGGNSSFRVKGPSRFGYYGNDDEYVKLSCDGANGFIDFFGNNPDGKLYINDAGHKPIVMKGPVYVDADVHVFAELHSQRVKVCPTGWCDYVFDNNYKLMPLTDVEKYIEKNGHLPDVPSAKEVEKDEVDLLKCKSCKCKK